MVTRCACKSTIESLRRDASAPMNRQGISPLVRNLDRTLSEERTDLHPLRVMLVGEPGIDGVFRHFEALARYLCSQGVQTDLAYSSVRSSDALCELIQFVEEHCGKTLDLLTGNWPGLTDISAFGALHRFVEERRPDVLHAHSSKAGALVRALRFRGVRQPLFYTPHAYYGMGRRGFPLSLLFDGIETLLSRVGQTINVSKTEAEYAYARLGLPPRTPADYPKRN